MSKKYDYLVVGAGLFGAVFAHEATLSGKKCLIIDRRSHIGGNAYTESVAGINVHKYGAHIFHTNDKKIWDYVNQFAEFNRFTNSPVARYKDELYNLPFNMNTFYRMWGVTTPEQAKAIIEDQRSQLGDTEPSNLEEQAISLVGRDLYEKLIKGYTEKQWGKSAEELPAFIIRRIPVRYTYDNNYFSDRYQGIPCGGYTAMIEKMLEGSDIRLNCDYFENKDELRSICAKTVFTGMIDEFYEYCYGELEYRSLKFETEVIDCENYQGNAVVNYTEYEIPYTRVIEHKHFEFGTQPKTVITREYPATWKHGDEPFYPLNDERNNKLYELYKKKANEEADVIFGGRLGMYKYFDMHNVIAAALDCAEKELNVNK